MTDVRYHPLVDRDSDGLDKSPMFSSPEREKVAGIAVEYSDRLWLNLIDRVTVYADRRLVFRFKDGTEIAEKL
jgi:hypothetical protein